jgi:hypothetical protein
MPFGLTKSHVVFQHLMNDVFCEYLDDFIVSYIDDILIFSKNMEDYEHHLRFVLEKLRKVGFYTKLEKCEFHQFEMKFLGYVIPSDSIHMYPHKVQTIVHWATLVFIQNVQCVIGFANFYPHFIV